MTQRVVFYDDGTDPAIEPAYDEGEIVFVSEFEDSDGPTDFAARQPDYTGYLLDLTLDQNVKSSTHYVNTSGTPTITVRTALTLDRDFEVLPDGTDEVRFSLPGGTVTSFDFDNSETTNVSTQDFVFKTTIRGIWKFTFEPPFPYSTCAIEITCNADV